MSWGLPLCILVNKHFSLSVGGPGSKTGLRYVSPLLLLRMFPTYAASLHGTPKFLQNRYSFRDKECVRVHVCVHMCVCAYRECPAHGVFLRIDHQIYLMHRYMHTVVPVTCLPHVRHDAGPMTPRYLI